MCFMWSGETKPRLESLDALWTGRKNYDPPAAGKFQAPSSHRFQGKHIADEMRILRNRVVSRSMQLTVGQGLWLFAKSLSGRCGPQNASLRPFRQDRPNANEVPRFFQQKVSSSWRPDRVPQSGGRRKHGFPRGDWNHWNYNRPLTY